MATSVDVRQELVDTVRLDLIGPDNDHAFAHELLFQAPSKWYLTGFLVPSDTPLEQRSDETVLEQVDSADDRGAIDDAVPPERDASRRGMFPSSLGLSFLIDSQTPKLDIKVQWGDYSWEGKGNEKNEVEADNIRTELEKNVEGYRRHPREESVTVLLPKPGERRRDMPVPNSRGLKLSILCRNVVGMPLSSRMPSGILSVSIFLVNNRNYSPEYGYREFIYQAKLSITSPSSFIPRPDLRGGLKSNISNEWDERISDLHYRDAYEYAVGHGVSIIAEKKADGSCSAVHTSWIPSAEVERVEASAIPEVVLEMEALGAMKDGEEAKLKLFPLITHYRDWILSQKQKFGNLEANQRQVAQELMLQAEYASKRIEAGIHLLSNPGVLLAFKVANNAMAQAARRREAIQAGIAVGSTPSPRWRPFQLAYILMTIQGIAEPMHDDREIVDLLFFPTGGGKTEAYLGLAAFAIVIRRLNHPGIRSAGVTVLMRYTLRLLTLDQLGRAASLMCALELERLKDPRLGDWPFEIGLWVGTAATPNRMGYQGYEGLGKDETAYAKWRRFQNNSKNNPAPIPIENCPWCGTKFEPQSFRLKPDLRRPDNLVVYCQNIECEFSGDRPLPILGVDEPIYQRLPAFIIATIDKFASLPWVTEVGALFGRVDRYDENGFYGPARPDLGRPLGGYLPPPDLIIQDELHLISGPLGTIAGIYETAIDALASARIGEKLVRPKIIASTATVRRAESQINALFDRNQISIFPPPGSDRRDSFFAHVVYSTQTPARVYLGIGAQGRSPKVLLLRTAVALLSASQTIYVREGGKRVKNNPADPYMTLLGYFNSLRELGGSRRIVEDTLKSQLEQYSRRRRIEPEESLFSDREIKYDVLELTSRVSTNEVAKAKQRLGSPYSAAENVDVALATNMISVGLDIIRLGLMVVFGQPKSRAEYIQATSRVGRDPLRPGLVITLLNIHKPRDRSHYERFENFHDTFYRAVEPTSVTPFSPRALDRALVGALIGLCRHSVCEMTTPLGATKILALRSQLEEYAVRFAERASNHNKRLSHEEKEEFKATVLARCRNLFDDWHNIAFEFSQTGTKLKYQEYEKGEAQRLLYDFLDPQLSDLPNIRKKFRANRSMRDVEPSVDIFIRNLNDWTNAI